MTGGMSRRLPKWFAILGVVLALIGELSWLFLMTPKALPLIPLVRFRVPLADCRGLAASEHARCRIGGLRPLTPSRPPLTPR
ncbi:MAG: hypothetical protein JWP25_8667 [Bradyrhizobium sp.]|nr:hypothetical protein [Bradyrhizobium sp.]